MAQSKQEVDANRAYEEYGGEEELKSLLDTRKSLAKTTQELTDIGAAYGEGGKNLNYPEKYEAAEAWRGVRETQEILNQRIEERKRREAARQLIIEGTPAQFEEDRRAN